MSVLTVIAGPNGSGKSTLTEWLVQRGESLGEYLNADDIARDMKGSPEDVSRRAQQIVRDMRDVALADGRDHAFETVMSHPSHIDYMAKAALNGFEVRFYFVATDDPVINIDRVANRVHHGGHDVPPERIVSRYERCLANLPAALATANVSDIFDNSSADRPLRAIAHISRSRGKAHLTHRNIARKGRWDVDPDDIPVWWFELLLELKPDHPFRNGPLP